MHLAANFVVQAALTATRDSATIREALTALSGKFKVRLMPRLAGLQCEQGACCHVGASTCLPLDSGLWLQATKYYPTAHLERDVCNCRSRGGFVSRSWMLHCILLVWASLC